MSSTHILDEIQAHYAQLSTGERRVAEYVRDHFTQVSRMSIRQLGQTIGVSEPTVFRFCQALGYQGFTEFKISLAEQNPTFQEYFSAAPSEGKGEVQALVERLLLSERDIFTATLRTMDYARLEAAADQVLSARRVLLFGISTSYSVAHDTWRRLVRLGLTAWALNEYHEAVPLMTSFDAGDLLVCITQTGETRETVETARKARELGIPVICVTAFPASPAGRCAGLVLPTFAPAQSDNRVGVTTHTAQSAVMDALYMAVAHRLGSQAATLLQSSNVSAMRSLP